jgi:hypothetical protein
MASFNEYLSTPGIEGGSKNVFHYTQNQAGRSGLTIGRGLDLGVNSEHDLKQLGIKQSVINKLKPFIGKVGEAAKKMHGEKSPLEYDEYVHVIDKTVNSNLAKIEKAFNEDSIVGTFKALPEKLQHMIGSVYFQMGTNNPSETAPGFWKQVTTGDWSGLEKNMQDFKMTQTIFNEQTQQLEMVPFPAGDDRRRLEWKLLKDSGWSVEKLNQNYSPKSNDETSLINNWSIEDNPFNLA